MKGVIIYKSKYGATKQCAEWIKEETGFEAVPVKEAKRLADYDIIIIGGSILAGGYPIASWVKGHWGMLRKKQCVFFSTSGALKDGPEVQENFKKAFPESIRSHMPYFPMGGKIIFDELKGFEKSMMNFAVKMTEKSDPAKAAEMKKDVDNLNRDDIKPLIKHIKKIQSGK